MLKIFTLKELMETDFDKQCDFGHANKGVNKMALITPDFSEVKEDVTPGTYKGIIKKGEIKEWPSGGQYVRWEMETYGETEPKNNGRRIFVNTSTSGKGAFVLQKLYRAATGQALTGKFDTEQLVGKQVEVDMAERNGYIDMKSVRSVSTN